VSRGGAVW